MIKQIIDVNKKLNKETKIKMNIKISNLI
jgi:hypothetical protein